MIDVARNTRKRTLNKTLAWSFWAANLIAIFIFWLPLGLPEVVSGDLPTMFHAVGRLFGLFATFCALTQFVVMGRVGWLEPIFGLDRLAIFHRRNGMATISFILLHSSLMTLTHPLLQGSTNFLDIIHVPYVWMAMIAEVLFILTVGLSIYIVRKHLKFETWYVVHLLNYLAIALVPWHQLTNGGDFLTNPLFANYWIVLYVFTALNVLYWRFGMTIIKFTRHDFTVEKVVKETPTATSVYIKVRNLDRFKAKGGQFVLVRFLAKPFIFQEHPFSLSMLPSSEHLRLTIRQVGDFTNMIPQLQPGTKVWVHGPFGAFTHEQQRTNKLLYIVGGIGITPIRSMIEDQARRGESGNAVLLYGNRTANDTIFLDELTQLGKQIAMPMYNVLSEQKDYKGEKGYIDIEKIERLVPDVRTRDVFICGPPPMMYGLIDELKKVGMPAAQIHYERFSLHKD
ncbi:MAG TPA: ferredoxin reductase family protein [Magnetospirillaceae bacterium]|nr:ferredoxin reductase family protein [Magnetospirillaceae bacterium]